MNSKKRILALLMCICMIFTLLPFSVLADNEGNENGGTDTGESACAQKGDIVYGSYDTNGENWTPDDELTAANAVKQYPAQDETSATGANITYSKTAAKAEGDNTYDITLNVTATAKKTAVVLVMDTSFSAYYCADCGETTVGEHSSGCYYSKHTEEQGDNATYLAAEKAAATGFVNSYAGTVEGMGRYIQLVSFRDKAYAKLDRWVDVSTAEGKAKVLAAISNVEQIDGDDYDTVNGGKDLIQGLNKANELIVSAPTDNKFAIVLTNSKPTQYDGTVSIAKRDADGEYVRDENGSIVYEEVDKIHTDESAVSTGTTNEACKLRENCTVYTAFIRDAQNFRFGNTNFDVFLRNYVATEGCALDNSSAQVNGERNRSSWLKKVLSNEYGPNQTDLPLMQFGVTSGFTVTDPMGKYMELLKNTLIDCRFDNNTIVWTPTIGAATDNNNGSVTVSYTLKYKVKVNTAAEGFEYDKYYPTNGDTTLSFADGQVYERRPNYDKPIINPNTGEQICWPDGTPRYDWLPDAWYDIPVTLHFNVPGVMVKYIPKDWNIDVSKTATELKKDANGDYKTNVTLSVPGVEESLATDVLLVLDSSKCSKDMLLATVNLLDDLAKQAENGANIKVGIVMFKGNAVPFKTFDSEKSIADIRDELSSLVVENDPEGDLTKDAVKAYIAKTCPTIMNSGTNIPAGLQLAKNMLVADTSVSDSRKYMVFVSDGNTYLFCHENADSTGYDYTKAWSRYGPSSDYKGGIAEYENWDYASQAMAKFNYAKDNSHDWTDYIAAVEANNDRFTKYDYEVAEAGVIPEGAPVIPETDTNRVVNSDVSRYQTATLYKELQSKYNCYYCALPAGDYILARPMLCDLTPADHLIDGTSIDVNIFSGITKDMFFAVGAGSTIEDTIGKDFTLDTESFKLTVGKTEYVAAKAGSEEGTIKYDFTKPGAAASTFSLVYTESSRSFTLNIGEDVTYAAPVQLSYTLKLTTPETKPGTYGQLDLNGDGKIDSTEVDVDTDKAIYTNNKATLTPVDSDGHEGVKKDFPKPSVEYTVKNPYRPPVNPGIYTEITVTITGNSDSVVYDGTEHNVKGYTVEISDSRYTEKDFTFSGKDIASGVNAGTYEMGLKSEQFKNTNALFKNVKFVIKADGVLTITPMDLTITAGSKDGIAPVTCNEYENTDLAKGDVIESVKITGEQLEPGQSPNVASDAVIKNAKGEDVTKNYNIKYVDGTLKAVEPLNKEDHFNYIVGYTDGTIRPNNNITRAEVAAIFFRLLTDEARSTFMTDDCSFSDVAQGAWCRRSIATLTNAEIISGYTDGTFKPNAPITRAELATIIARFAKLDVNTKTFSDINGHWAQKYIELAAGNGWIDGYTDGTFRPNQNIKRAETFAMINRVLDRVTESNSDLLPTDQMNMWSDNMDFDAWYYRDVQEATNNHKAERVGDSIYEKWTEKLPDIDWAAIQL